MPQKPIELILIRRLATYLSIPMFVVDADGTMLFYNEPAELLLGRRFDEAGEMKLEVWSTIFLPRDEHGEALAPEALPLFVAIRERRPAHRIIQFTGLDGVAKRVEVTAFPLAGLSGRLLGAVAAFWSVDGV
jgi:PAS domain-containing protein